MGSDFKLFGCSIPLSSDCGSPLHHSRNCDGSLDPGGSGEKDAGGAMDMASMAVKCNEILAIPEGGGKVIVMEVGGVGEALNMVEEKDEVGGVGEASNMIEEKDEERSRIINNGEKIVMKRPEILIPCPRCESLDTKFCYFNNCNANQPRHFCRSCQRYWTAGGTLRNLPMGSGRRKSKNPSSSHPHNHPRRFHNLNNDNLLLRSDVLDSAQQLPPAGGAVSTTYTTSRHLKMGPSLPASEIPKFEPNVAGQDDTFTAHGSNDSCATYTSNEQQPPSNLDELACSSSMGTHAQACETTTEALKQQPATEGPFLAPSSLPVGPWPYDYGLLGWNNGSYSEVGKSLATPSEAWCGNPWMGGGFPWPLMPFPSWASPGSWVGRPWNMPLMPPLQPWGFPMLPAMVNGNSPTLGKHPREGAPNGCFLIPKTLRTQDPKEAAQSSIWSALGLDNNNRPDLPPHGIFKGFPPKSNTEAENEELSAQAIHMNPTAMTRSVAFHENT